MSIAIIAQWVKTWNIIIKVPVVFKLKCKNQIPNLRVTRFSRRFVYIWTNIFNIFFLKIKRYLNKNQYFVCQILTSVIELNPPTHLHQFHTNLGKIQYVSESQQTQTSPKAFDPFLLFLKKKKELDLGFSSCCGPVFALLRSKRTVFKSFSDSFFRNTTLQHK